MLVASLVSGCAAPAADPPREAQASQPLGDATWEETGSLGGARVDHAAVRLADGRVLVMGGLGAANAQFGEMFDPKTGAWTLLDLAGPTEVRPDGPRGALLPNGKVLLAGGYSTGMPDVPTVGDVFDPAEGTWTKTGPLAATHQEAAMSELEDGRVLMTGGWEYNPGPSVNTAEIYDPSTGAWTPAAPMLHARRNHLSVRLADGRVLVAGGDAFISGQNQLLSTAEIYDPATDTWKSTSSLLVARAGRGALLHDGRVLFSGGDDIEVYSPAKGTWKSLPDLPVPRYAPLVVLETGAVLVAGGVDATSADSREVDLFDPTTETWAPARRLRRARHGHSLTLLADGSVLAAGGVDQASAEIFRLGGPGDECATGLACESGFCADGVCCESACLEACHFCAAPGSAGACLPVKAGDDPRRECGSGAPCADACMEGGACGSKAGFPCGAAACAEDGRSAVEQGLCIAGEEACPTETVECGAYLCQPDRLACGGSCAVVGDCAPGYACDLSQRCVPPPDPVAGDPGDCSVSAPGSLGDPRLPAAPARAALALAAVLFVLRRRR